MGKYREPQIRDLLEDYKAHVALCSDCRERRGTQANKLCKGGARLWARYVKAKNGG